MLINAPAVYGRPSLLGLTFPLLCCASRDHLPKKPLALKFLSQVYFWGKRTHNTSYPRLPRAPLSERICAAHECPVHGTLAPWYTAVLCSPVPRPGFQYTVLHRRSGKCSPCPRRGVETLVKQNGTVGRMSWTPAGLGRCLTDLSSRSLPWRMNSK